MVLSSRRNLLRALALSGLIHVVLLVGPAALLLPRFERPSRPVQVTMAPPADAGRNEAEMPTKDHSVGESGPRRPAYRTPATPLPLMPQESASPVVASSVPKASQPERPTPQIVRTVREARRGEEMRPVSPTEAREGVSADEVRQYRMALAIAARPFKGYPKPARENRWEGTAEIAVRVDANLPQPQVTLEQSSGHKLLDEAAREMMARASASVPLPSGLRGRDFRMVVPVQFRLNDDGTGE